MKKDSANKKVYSLKRLNKVMGFVLFGTAFLMTFLFIDKNIRANSWIIVVSVFASAMVIEIIVWIILYFTFKKKQLTENDIKIQKALDQIKKEQEETLEEREQQLYKEAEKDLPDDLSVEKIVEENHKPKNKKIKK